MPYIVLLLPVCQALGTVLNKTDTALIVEAEVLCVGLYHLHLTKLKFIGGKMNVWASLLLGLLCRFLQDQRGWNVPSHQRETGGIKRM